MTNTQPKISSLQPIVLEDNKRITLDLNVDNLPPIANAFFAMPDMETDAPPKPTPDNTNADEPSPYPNIELSVLDGQRQQVASLYIIEYKEQHTSLTLHIAQPNLQEIYIARAEMTHQDKTIDVAEVPFTLHQAASLNE